MSNEQGVGSRERSRLEAYTFSNRGEMRQHLPTGYDIYLSPPWLEASTSNPLVLGTGFQPAVLQLSVCRGLRPRLLKV